MEKAQSLFTRAIQGGRVLGLRPLSARSELALGQLYRRAGDLDQARTYLASSLASFAEMQMPIWLQKAEAELQALN